MVRATAEAHFLQRCGSAFCLQRCGLFRLVLERFKCCNLQYLLLLGRFCDRVTGQW